MDWEHEGCMEVAVVRFASYMSLSTVKISRLIVHPFNKGTVWGKAMKTGSVL